MALPLIVALSFAADGPPTSIRLFNTLDGMGIGTIEGKQTEIHTYTRSDYTLEKSRDSIKLLLLRSEVHAQSGGRTIMKNIMSAAGAESEEIGKVPVKILAADAPKDWQELIKSLFGGPVCELKIDERGNELRRSMPEMSPVAQGMARTTIVNSLFHHPAYFDGQDVWTSDRTLSQDAHMQLRGELRYERRPPPKGLPADYHLVHVSGKLKGVPLDAGVVPEDLPLDVTSVASGTQIFDSKRRVWVWSDIHLNIDTKRKGENGEQFRGLMIYRLGEPFGPAIDVSVDVESTTPPGSFITTSSAWLLQGRRADGVHRFRAAQLPGTMWAEFLSIDSEAKFKTRIAEASRRSAKDFESATAPKETNDEPRPGLSRWIKQGTVRRKDVPDFYLAHALVWNAETNVALELVFEAKMPLSQWFSGQRERFLSESIDAMSASFR